MKQLSDKEKRAQWRVGYIQTIQGRALRLINNARARSIAKGIEIDLPVAWLIEKLVKNECEITNLPFDLSRPEGHTRRYNAPSLDRIDKTKGYTPDNTRLVLWLVNCALSEYGSDVVLPVLKEMVKGLENAQTNTAAPVPARDHQESEHDAKRRAVLAARLGEDRDDAHHHCGTIHWEDVNHRAQASSGNSVGHGGQEVATPIYPEGFKDPWEYPTKIIGVKD